MSRRTSSADTGREYSIGTRQKGSSCRGSTHIDFRWCSVHAVGVLLLFALLEILRAVQNTKNETIKFKNNVAGLGQVRCVVLLWCVQILGCFVYYYNYVIGCHILMWEQESMLAENIIVTCTHGMMRYWRGITF